MNINWDEIPDGGWVTTRILQPMSLDLSVGNNGHEAFRVTPDGKLIMSEINKDYTPQPQHPYDHTILMFLLGFVLFRFVGEIIGVIWENLRR